MRQVILRTLVAVAVGVIFGWASAGPLKVLTWANVLVWGAATVSLGMVDGSRNEKGVRLAVYGFALGFAFMCFGYTGQETLLSRTPFFAFIGAVCAVCAVLLGWVMHQVMTRVSQR